MSQHIRKLIAESSLGTPEAQALIASVPPELAERAMQRVRDLRVIGDLARDLMAAKHDDNPDAPLAMVRAGAAQPLAEALWRMGWRRQSGDQWVVSELHLNLAGPPPEGQVHPETAPVGPFASREDADAWARGQIRIYGSGSWSVAPIRNPNTPVPPRDEDSREREEGAA